MLLAERSRTGLAQPVTNETVHLGSQLTISVRLLESQLRHPLMILMKKITNRLRRVAKHWLAKLRERIVTEYRWISYRNKRRSPRIDCNVIVSITSYPPRFGVLPLTLKTLLMQSYPDYRLILWIAHDDYKAVPRSVLRLTRSGLEIMTCPDLRVFTKLIPAMRRFPDSIIVTADDDVCY